LVREFMHQFMTILFIKVMPAVKYALRSGLAFR